MIEVNIITDESNDYRSLIAYESVSASIILARTLS